MNEVIFFAQDAHSLEGIQILLVPEHSVVSNRNALKLAWAKRIYGTNEDSHESSNKAGKCQSFSRATQLPVTPTPSESASVLCPF